MLLEKLDSPRFSINYLRRCLLNLVRHAQHGEKVEKVRGLRSLHWEELASGPSLVPAVSTSHDRTVPEEAARVSWRIRNQR